MRTGVANLPLHGGRAPPWLFKRMVSLAEGILEVTVDEYGTRVLLQRISDPFWFQALSCVLGYDWHSSGTTTVTCGALKEALKRTEIDLVIAGGKGAASRRTPREIEDASSSLELGEDQTSSMVRNSRMSAKVDTAALQDGHDLYHHVYMFDSQCNWAVVQQGMCDSSKMARRYHWLGEGLTDLVSEPHSALMGEKTVGVLDMTSRDSSGCRNASLDLVNDGPRRFRHFLRETTPMNQRTLDDWCSASCGCRGSGASNKSGPSPRYVDVLSMPRSINWRALEEAYESQPSNYETLLGMEGVGPSTVRALSLVSELVYGEEPSWRDPVKYSFAVGGKDGVPFPVDRRAMDEAADVLRRGVDAARVGDRDRLRAVGRLRKLVPPDIQ